MDSKTPKLTCAAEGVGPRSWAWGNQPGVLPASGLGPCEADAGPAAAVTATSATPAITPMSSLCRKSRDDPITPSSFSRVVRKGPFSHPDRSGAPSAGAEGERNGAAQESNLPSRGLRDLTGFEDQLR